MALVAFIFKILLFYVIFLFMRGLFRTYRVLSAARNSVRNSRSDAFYEKEQREQREQRNSNGKHDKNVIEAEYKIISEE